MAAQGPWDTCWRVEMFGNSISQFVMQGPWDTCWGEEMFGNCIYQFLMTIAEVSDQVRSIETLLFTIFR